LETLVTEETSTAVCREGSYSRDSSHRRDSRDEATAVRTHQQQAPQQHKRQLEHLGAPETEGMSKPVETLGEEGLQLRAVKEITGTSGDANNRDANNSREATTAGRQQQQGGNNSREAKSSKESNNSTDRQKRWGNTSSSKDVNSSRNVGNNRDFRDS
jgi:hypothetical protein